MPAQISQNILIDTDQMMPQRQLIRQMQFCICLNLVRLAGSNFSDKSQMCPYVVRQYLRLHLTRLNDDRIHTCSVYDVALATTRYVTHVCHIIV